MHDVNWKLSSTHLHLTYIFLIWIADFMVFGFMFLGLWLVFIYIGVPLLKNLVKEINLYIELKKNYRSYNSTYNQLLLKQIKNMFEISNIIIHYLFLALHCHLIFNPLRDSVEHTTNLSISNVKSYWTNKLLQKIKRIQILMNLFIS